MCRQQFANMFANCLSCEGRLIKVAMLVYKDNIEQKAFSLIAFFLRFLITEKIPCLCYET